MRAHLFLLILGSSLLALPAWADNAPTGRVVGLRGEVSLVRAHSASSMFLAVGDPIWTGDHIRTGTDSRAQLLLEDRSVINLGPGTELTIGVSSASRRGGLSLKLVVGSLWARVSHTFGGDRDFDVTTANAVAGVRGTSFFMEALEGEREMRLTVLRGTVELRDPLGGLALVHALQQGVAQQGIPIRVQPASAELVALLRARLGGVASIDPQRLKSAWQSVREGMAAAPRRTAGPSDRPISLGGQLPVPLLNLEPGGGQARVRGQIQIEPDPQ